MESIQSNETEISIVYIFLYPSIDRQSPNDLTSIVIGIHVFNVYATYQTTPQPAMEHCF